MERVSRINKTIRYLCPKEIKSVDRISQQLQNQSSIQ